jgi:hypothetical protein
MDSLDLAKKQKELHLCNFMMIIASKERLIELKRQTLSQQEDFEPYVAFKRITRKSNPHGITNDCLQEFFKQNAVKVSPADSNRLINHSTSEDPEAIHYKDFLNLVLPKDHSDLRAHVSQKDPYDIDDDQNMSEETENCLKKLLIQEIQ